MYPIRHFTLHTSDRRFDETANMPVKSLVDLASAACIKHIRQLDSVGDFLPYENVRHILARVENAQQLRRIELNSPQLEGRTGELWLKLIERDFPLEYRARAYKPQNPAKWYRVWERYKKDHDQSVEAGVEQFKSAFAGLRQDREKNTSKIVEGKLLPDKGRVKKTRRPVNHASDRLAFTSGSKTKTHTGADVMRRVRREVKEIKSIHGSLSRNTEYVNRVRGLGQVRQAPRSMINEHRIAAQPSAAIPMKPSASAPAPVPKKSAAVKEFEARATFISDSEDDLDEHDEYDDEDDGEDLFDGPKKAPPPRPMSKARPHPEPRPRAEITAPSRASPVKPAAKKTATAGSPTKSGLAGRMAQKFGNPHVAKKLKPAAETSRTTSTTTMTESASSARKAPARHSPPPRASSPQEPEPKPTLAPPRKRKAVDVFMRPKKRVP